MKSRIYFKQKREEFIINDNTDDNDDHSYRVMTSVYDNIRLI